VLDAARRDEKLTGPERDITVCIWMVTCPPTTGKNSPVIEVAGAS